MATVEKITQENIGGYAKRMEKAEPQELLSWAINRFHPRLLLACSFGGASGMVLLDMAVKLKHDVRVFYLDTDFLFPETYETLRKVEAKYGIKVEAYKSEYTPDQQAAKFGPELWKRDPDKCCDLRKVEPNRKAMATVDAWITGLRKDQSKSREATPVLQWDEGFDVVKVNPLASWTEDQAWHYVRDHKIIVNPLLGRGFKSIGCTYCTRITKPGEDARAGRWEGFEKDECGLHVAPKAKAPKAN
ncbi:MAG: phosphoadenylyl-sulfate reductase [Chloroflexi bacterium]|nr:phosphoadenylyl-sulfate reductase [Chloroflexota bacterium]